MGCIHQTGARLLAAARLGRFDVASRPPVRAAAAPAGWRFRAGVAPLRDDARDVRAVGAAGLRLAWLLLAL
ncbi:hypothetical protein ACFPRL_32675 [Pseudoclavibacter helvolus]